MMLLSRVLEKYRGSRDEKVTLIPIIDVAPDEIETRAPVRTLIRALAAAFEHDLRYIYSLNVEILNYIKSKEGRFRRNYRGYTMPCPGNQDLEAKLVYDVIDAAFDRNYTVNYKEKTIKSGKIKTADVWIDTLNTDVPYMHFTLLLPKNVIDEWKDKEVIHLD